MSAFAIPHIPEKLTDAEARRLLDQLNPQIRALGDEIVRNNTRADEGERTHKQLMEKATESFGVDHGDGRGKVIEGGQAGVEKILEERLHNNSEKIRRYFAALEEVKLRLEAIGKPSLSR